MNKWKVAFWICFSLLVIVVGSSLHVIIDQSVTLTYQNVGYTDTENDLETVVEIFGNTRMSKTEMETALKAHKYSEYMDFLSDTIHLCRVSLIFENDTLREVAWQW